MVKLLLSTKSVCVCLYVSAPEAINYILMILNLYNQLNKFVAFRNITKLLCTGVVFVTKHNMTETNLIRP